MGFSGVSLSLFKVKDPIATYNSLPITGNTENDLRVVQDTDIMYTWSIAASSGLLSDWKAISISNLDEITDGSTYKKVKATEITSGQIIRVRAVTAGADVSGDSIKSAVDNSHTQNTDTKLDEGGTNEVTAADVKLAVTDKHSHTNKAALDTAIVDTTDLLTAFGSDALSGQTSGQRNVAIGEQTLKALTTQILCVAVGNLAGATAVGNFNTLLGHNAGNSCGESNTLLGQSAGQSIGAVDNNVMIGRLAGQNAVSSSNNVYIGQSAGKANNGSSNVLIGYQVGNTNRAWANKLAIDNSDRADPLIFGDFTARTLLINGDFESTKKVTSTLVNRTQTLTDAENISWDSELGTMAIVILGGARTLSNPTNVVAGMIYRLIVKQDATGSRTLAYGANFKFPGDVTPVLSSTASAVDILEFIAESTSVLHLVNFISDSK